MEEGWVKVGLGRRDGLSRVKEERWVKVGLGWRDGLK